MPKIFLNQFAEKEEGVYLKIRQFRDWLFEPLVSFLAQKKVNPDVLTYIGFSMIAFFVYFFGFNPWFAFIFLGANLLFDALDGALARKLEKHSSKGVLLDIACDHLGFVIVLLTFINFEFVHPFWASLYIVAYLIWVFLSLILRSLHVQFFPVFRSRMVVYFFLFIYLLTAQNFLTPILMVFAVYLLVSDLILFYKLQCSL